MRLTLVTLALVILAALVWVFLPLEWKLRIEEEAAVRAYLQNREGIRSLNNQDAGQATQYFSQALSENPGEDKLHYNLALSLQLGQKAEDAERSYHLVLKSPTKTPEEAFLTEYNLGTLFQAAKNIDQALKHYQAALDLNPSSLETKINIELLIQQGGGKGQGDGEQKQDPKEGEGQGKDQQDKDGDGKPDQPKEYAKNPKPQKPQFKSEELSPSDVNKILGEIKQQEQRIRADFNRKDAKEQKREKDW